jgi:hypothetical protein
MSFLLILLKRPLRPSLKLYEGRISNLIELSQPFVLQPAQGLWVERVYLFSSCRLGMNQSSVS